MPPQALFNIDQIDFTRPPLYDIEAIRRINPQRNQMEHLTAVVYEDLPTHTVVGYKDVTEEEFWVPGHMPGFPLMPGVIMCESVAQLSAFYTKKHKLMAGDFMGFGGMDAVRFRSPVFPNSRLVIVCQVKEIRPTRRCIADFQGFVKDRMVFEGTIIGVPLFRSQGINAPNA